MGQPSTDGIVNVLTHHLRIARQRIARQSAAARQPEHVASWQSAI